jgi:hypothetical protein
MQTAPYENAIVARVQGVTPRVFVSEVPDSTPTPAFPYVTLFFGGPIRAGTDHHITSSRNDTMVAYGTAQVQSLTDASARDVADVVRNALSGFIPPNCGELIIEGGLSYSNGTNAVPPTKYYREVGFTFRTNLQSAFNE